MMFFHGTGRLVGCFVAAFLCPSVLMGADWPQWGGTHARNMVSDEVNLPESFEPGRKQGGSIDLATTKNVRWVAKLGTNAYGNATVGEGRVLVGTDAYTLDEDSRFDGGHVGVVKCFSNQG